MGMVKLVGIAGLALWLVACGGKSGTEMSDGPGDMDAVSGGGASASGMDEGGFGAGGAYSDDYDEGMGASGGALDTRIIYFGYDQSDVDAEAITILEAHGAYLAENTGASVRLEGHGDERGSREYNIGLGENRAQAVRQVLLLQGVSSVQISTVSYGEERPALLGGDEEAWSLNRRVEVIYGE
jgi:peptidoglycan-associated lipoprotein